MLPEYVFDSIPIFGFSAVDEIISILRSVNFLPLCYFASFVSSGGGGAEIRGLIYLIQTGTITLMLISLSLTKRDMIRK